MDKIFILILMVAIISCGPVRKITPQVNVINKDSLKLSNIKKIDDKNCYDTVALTASYKLTPQVRKSISKGTVGNPIPEKDPINITVVDVNNETIYNKTTQMGNVVYKIPNLMHVRNSYQVLVRISKSEANIYENINGEVSHSKIPITETMQVNLIDDSPTDSKNFDIVKDNDSIQLVDTNGTYTQWTWNVTPIKVGTGKLKVVISVIRDGNKKDIVYEDSVSIKMDLPKQIVFWVNKYWQWLMTSLIIPFVVWLYKKITKDETK